MIKECPTAEELAAAVANYEWHKAEIVALISGKLSRNEHAGKLSTAKFDAIVNNATAALEMHAKVRLSTIISVSLGLITVIWHHSSSFSNSSCSGRR